MSEGPSIDIRIRINREQAEEFLSRVTRDPDFRAQVEADPAGALREYGVEISDDLVPHLAQLPDPEDIEALRQQVGVSEYAEAGAERPAGPWFMIMIWFLRVPKTGGDAAG